MSLLPFPRFRAFDANGEPLDGGKLYTYAAGTSTPLATYTDSTLSVANTNPVLLDDEGYCDVWGVNDTLYKFELRDADDATLWTIDNIPGIGNAGADTAAGFGTATTITSSTTTDLGTIDSHVAVVTGSTTIDSFGSSADVDAPIYIIRFQGALQLTHSASLLLPGSVNITTAAADHCFSEYLGSGAWRVFGYNRADGSIDATTIRCTAIIETGG